jgi:TolB-like protein/DNA-binding winged helix-turn-helix (wHTH) protein/tetratricopeptide (TPR) repeat protein
MISCSIPANARSWRGDGEIRLSKLSFDFLEALVEAAPNLLTHDELVEAVWGPKRVVTPENLSQRLMLLRQALGDRAEAPRYIEAARGQGYRLIGEVEVEVEVEAGAAAPGRRRRLLPGRRVTIASGTVLAAVLAAWMYFSPEKPASIVVLPCVGLSSDPAQRSIVDGVTRELISSLQRLPGLSVIGPTTSFALRDSERTVPDIAAELGVQYALECSLGQEGEQSRVRASLSDASGSSVSLPYRYDGAIDNLFDAENEIVSGIVETLRLTLDLDQAQRGVSTDSAEAHELYLAAMAGRGGAGWNSGPPGAWELAQLKRALRIDPRFVEAWQMTSEIHILRSQYSDEERKPELMLAEEAAQRAIDLAPDRGEGYSARASLKALRGDWADAERDFQHARDLGYGDVRDYGLLLVAAGRLESARELIEQFRETDPLNQNLLGVLMQVHEELRDVDAADAVYRRGRALFGEQWAYGDGAANWIRLGRGEVGELDIPDPLFTGFAERIGDRDAALALLNDAAQDPRYQSAVGFGNLAIWAAYFGETQLVVELLETSVSRSAFLMHVVWLPVFDEVRQSPEFQSLLIRMGLVDYWRATGWPRVCRSVGSDDFACA